MADFDETPSPPTTTHTQQGVPTKNHRVQKELERVKGYMTRLQVIKGPSIPGGAGAAAASKPALKVDTAASQRMVVSVQGSACSGA